MPSLATTHSIAFGSGSYTNATYLYLYGTRSAPNTLFANDVYLARVPLGQVRSTWLYQYLGAGGSWYSDVHSAAGLVDPRSGASNVVAVQPQAGGFGWVGTQNQYAGDAWTAAGMLTPPYTRSGRLYYAPSDSTYYHYSGSSHPEHRLASGLTLASYSRNPKNAALLTRDGITTAHASNPLPTELWTWNQTCLPTGVGSQPHDEVRASTIRNPRPWLSAATSGCWIGGSGEPSSTATRKPGRSACITRVSAVSACSMPLVTNSLTASSAESTSSCGQSANAWRTSRRASAALVGVFGRL